MHPQNLTSHVYPSTAEYRAASNESVTEKLTLTTLHESAGERELDVKACKACSGVGKVYESMNIKDPSTDDQGKMPVSLALPRCNLTPPTTHLPSRVVLFCLSISL